MAGCWSHLGRKWHRPDGEVGSHRDTTTTHWVRFRANQTGDCPWRNPRDFGKPLAIGAPAPVLDIPFKPSRMIHFLDFSNEKMVAKVPDIAPTVDILLGNLEDAVPVDRKEAAREGLLRVGREMELGETQLWTRVNSLESPWVLDDITTVVSEIGHKIDVMMIPKVEGA